MNAPTPVADPTDPAVTLIADPTDRDAVEATLDALDVQIEASLNNLAAAHDALERNLARRIFVGGFANAETSAALLSCSAAHREVRDAFEAACR